jgi:Predicted transcriptional regulators
MENITEILKALSDETRLRILNLLYEKELCVCDIMGTLEITQAKASRHLIYLRNALSAFFAMNFTGASTYTSFSGVLKEMKTAVPLIILSLALGIVLLLASAFIPFI